MSLPSKVILAGHHGITQPVEVVGEKMYHYWILTPQGRRKLVPKGDCSVSTV